MKRSNDCSLAMWTCVDGGARLLRMFCHATARSLVGNAALLGLALLTSACSKRPADLTRVEALDEVCGEAGVAFDYSMDVKDKREQLITPAVKSGCSAPLALWTEFSDEKKGGVRQALYEKKNNERRGVLCCPP